MKNTRFKIIVQTTIGQMRDQGIRIASRCLWDAATDNYASCSYSNVRTTYIYMMSCHFYFYYVFTDIFLIFDGIIFNIGNFIL